MIPLLEIDNLLHPTVAERALEGSRPGTGLGSIEDRSEELEGRKHDVRFGKGAAFVPPEIRFGDAAPILRRALKLADRDFH